MISDLIKNSRKRKEKKRGISPEHEASIRIFYSNFTKSKPKKKPQIADKTGKRFRTSKVFNEKYPAFLELLYKQIFLGEGKLFHKKNIKYLTLSENKLSKIIGCSSSTARKCMEQAELDGLIKREYVTEYHALATPMSIRLTEEGKKKLHQKFFKHKKSTSVNYPKDRYNKNNNIKYKSTRAREIVFKKHDDSIVAQAWRAYLSIKGNDETITARKSGYLHYAIKLISKLLHIEGKENLISTFRQFVRSQIAFLKSPTFRNIFKLEGIYAYVKKLKAQIFKQEQEARELNNFTPISRIRSFNNSYESQTRRGNGCESFGNLISNLFQNINIKTE